MAQLPFELDLTGTAPNQVATKEQLETGINASIAQAYVDIDAKVAAEASARAAQAKSALANLAPVTASGTQSGTSWNVTWANVRGRIGTDGADVANVTALVVDTNQAAVINLADAQPYPVYVEANTSGLRAEIEAGAKIALLFNRQGALSGAIADAIKAGAAMAAASGALAMATEAQADAADAANTAALAMVSGAASGRTVRLLRETPNDPLYVLMDNDGEVALAVDMDGQQVYPDPQVIIGDDGLPEYMGYAVGSVVHGVAAEDTIMGDVAPHAVLSLAPGFGHVKAAIDKPSLSGTASYVAVAAGMIIPASEEVIHGIVSTGQSLDVGSFGDVDMPIIANPWPSDATMFQTTSGTDARMGLPVSGAIPDLVPSSLTGFAPARSVVSPASAGYGTTPIDRMGIRMSGLARSHGVRFVNIGMVSGRGGTSYAELKKNGTIPEIYDNLIAGVQRAYDLAAAQGKKLIIDALLWKHGEADQSTPAATYAGWMEEYRNDLDADVKAITGQSADVIVLMAPPSSFLQVGGPSLAMANLHRTNPLFSLTGPDYAYWAEYYTDLLHFKGPGYFLIGEKAGLQGALALWTPAAKSKPLIVSSVSRLGAVVTVSVQVPYPPMVLDTALVNIATQYGLKYSVGGVDYPATDVAITNAGGSGTGTITITLASAPPGTDGRLDVGWPGHASGGSRLVSTIPRTNFRDSDPNVSDFDGRRLYNWLCHDQITHS